MDAKTLKMIAGGAFAIAALSAIISFYMLVSFYSSRKMDLPVLTIAMNFAAIILSAFLADGCFAKQGKLIGCVLVIMTLFFAFSGFTSPIEGVSVSKMMGVLPTNYIASCLAIGGSLFAISTILGAVSALIQKRSKNLCLAFAIIALAAAVVGIIGNALMQTPLAPNTLKALMEGVGLFALGISYMKSISEKQAHTQKATVAALSSAQLSDYKQLLDQGIITQEEFDEQKKRFLQG